MVRTFYGNIGENISVVVKYDYSPAEKPVYDLESSVCGPGCPASIEIFEVFSPRPQEDLYELLSPEVLALLEEKINLQLGEDNA